MFIKNKIHCDNCYNEQSLFCHSPERRRENIQTYVNKYIAGQVRNFCSEECHQAYKKRAGAIKIWVDPSMIRSPKEREAGLKKKKPYYTFKKSA